MISLKFRPIMRNVSDQVVEGIKTQILCLFLHRKSCRLWVNVGKYGTDRQATDGNIIWRMRCFCRINKARMYTRSHNVRYTQLFDCNNSYANAPQCYVIIKKLAITFQLRLGVYH